MVSSNFDSNFHFYSSFDNLDLPIDLLVECADGSSEFRDRLIGLREDPLAVFMSPHSSRMSICTLATVDLMCETSDSILMTLASIGFPLGRFFENRLVSFVAAHRPPPRPFDERSICATAIIVHPFFAS